MSNYIFTIRWKLYKGGSEESSADGGYFKDTDLSVSVSQTNFIGMPIEKVWNKIILQQMQNLVVQHHYNEFYCLDFTNTFIKETDDTEIVSLSASEEDLSILVDAEVRKKIPVSVTFKNVYTNETLPYQTLLEDKLIKKVETDKVDKTLKENYFKVIDVFRQNINTSANMNITSVDACIPIIHEKSSLFIQKMHQTPYSQIMSSYINMSSDTVDSDVANFINIPGAPSYYSDMIEYGILYASLLKRRELSYLGPYDATNKENNTIPETFINGQYYEISKEGNILPDESTAETTLVVGDKIYYNGSTWIVNSTSIYDFIHQPTWFTDDCKASDSDKYFYEIISGQKIINTKNILRILGNPSSAVFTYYCTPQKKIFNTTLNRHYAFVTDDTDTTGTSDILFNTTDKIYTAGFQEDNTTFIIDSKYTDLDKYFVARTINKDTINAECIADTTEETQILTTSSQDYIITCDINYKLHASKFVANKTVYDTDNNTTDYDQILWSKTDKINTVALDDVYAINCNGSYQLDYNKIIQISEKQDDKDVARDITYKELFDNLLNITIYQGKKFIFHLNCTVLNVTNDNNGVWYRTLPSNDREVVITPSVSFEQNFECLTSDKLLLDKKFSRQCKIYTSTIDCDVTDGVVNAITQPTSVINSYFIIDNSIDLTTYIKTNNKTLDVDCYYIPPQVYPYSVQINNNTFTNNNFIIVKYYKYDLNVSTLINKIVNDHYLSADVYDSEEDVLSLNNAHLLAVKDKSIILTTAANNIDHYLSYTPNQTIALSTTKTHIITTNNDHDLINWSDTTTEVQRILKNYTIAGNTKLTGGVFKHLVNNYVSGVPGLAISDANITKYDDLRSEIVEELSFYKNDSQYKYALQLNDLTYIRCCHAQAIPRPERGPRRIVTTTAVVTLDALLSEDRIGTALIGKNGSRPHYLFVGIVGPGGEGHTRVWIVHPGIIEPEDHGPGGAAGGFGFYRINLDKINYSSIIFKFSTTYILMPHANEQESCTLGIYGADENGAETRLTGVTVTGGCVSGHDSWHSGEGAGGIAETVNDDYITTLFTIAGVSGSNEDHSSFTIKDTRNQFKAAIYNKTYLGAEITNNDTMYDAEGKELETHPYLDKQPEMLYMLTSGFLGRKPYELFPGTYPATTLDSCDGRPSVCTGCGVPYPPEHDGDPTLPADEQMPGVGGGGGFTWEGGSNGIYGYRGGPSYIAFFI